MPGFLFLSTAGLPFVALTFPKIQEALFLCKFLLPDFIMRSSGREQPLLRGAGKVVDEMKPDVPERCPDRSRAIRFSVTGHARFLYFVYPADWQSQTGG